MYFGNAGLARFAFIGVGFWVVMVSAFAFLLVFGVGSTRGKRAAKLWVDMCVALTLLGAGGDVLWAWLSGEWRSYLVAYGTGPLFEMFLLAVLFLGTMWFMAIRYTDGLKD